MAQSIRRRVLGPVEVRRHRYEPGRQQQSYEPGERSKGKRKKKSTTTQVPEPDLDGHARRSLIGAGEIVGQPGDVAGEGGVDAADGDEDASVHEARQVAARGGDGDDEAEGDEAQADEDEGRARALAVREPGHDDG